MIMLLDTQVRERSDGTNYTHHDQLFKRLIHTFFEEFIEVFFPDVHAHIKYQDIKPLSEEVFTDLHDGFSKRLDIVIEAKYKETDALIIIHIEPQSYHQKIFPEKMYHYFNLLYNRYRVPIIPIAVFSYNEKRIESNQFKIDFPFITPITFNFLKLELNRLNWRDYLIADNPAALALLSNMDYTKKERVKVKIEFLRLFANLNVDSSRQRLIYGFFERYLKLNDEEEERLMGEIDKLDLVEKDKIMELPISYEEKGKEIGRKEGLKKGRMEVAKEMLNEGLSIDLITRVTHLSKDEVLKLRDER